MSFVPTTVDVQADIAPCREGGGCCGGGGGRAVGWPSLDTIDESVDAHVTHHVAGRCLGACLLPHCRRLEQFDSLRPNGVVVVSEHHAHGMGARIEPRRLFGRQRVDKLRRSLLGTPPDPSRDSL